ncbi:MAG TPA: nitrite reductase small subunit NirD [Polyangiales bacterium]
MSKNVEVERPWTRVCALEDILPNTGVCGLVGRDQVAVFRVGDSSEVYAIGNFDPFSRANVLSRGLVGDRGGRIKVASPIFKQSFALDTGECLDDASVSVPTYDVRLSNGIVEVREQVTHALRPGNSGVISEIRTA